MTSTMPVRRSEVVGCAVPLFIEALIFPLGQRIISGIYIKNEAADAASLEEEDLSRCRLPGRPAEFHETGLGKIADLVANALRQGREQLLGIGVKHKIRHGVDGLRLFDLLLQLVFHITAGCYLNLGLLGLGALGFHMLLGIAWAALLELVGLFL